MYKEKSQRKMSVQIPKYSTVLSLYPNYTLIHLRENYFLKIKQTKRKLNFKKKNRNKMKMFHLYEKMFATLLLSL